MLEQECMRRWARWRTRTGRVLGLRAADDFDEFEVGELPVDLLSLGQSVAQDLLRDVLDAVLSS